MTERWLDGEIWDVRSGQLLCRHLHRCCKLSCTVSAGLVNGSILRGELYEHLSVLCVLFCSILSSTAVKVLRLYDRSLAPYVQFHWVRSHLFCNLSGDKMIEYWVDEAHRHENVLSVAVMLTWQTWEYYICGGDADFKSSVWLTLVEVLTWSSWQALLKWKEGVKWGREELLRSGLGPSCMRFYAVFCDDTICFTLIWCAVQCCVMPRSAVSLCGVL